MNDLVLAASDLAPDRAARGALPHMVSPAVVTSAGQADWLRALIDRELHTVGALLFRGFPVRALEDFERMVERGTPALLSYEFGSTPRSRVQNKVYTSTEYPAHQHIPLHNEQSYTAEWPLKIWFYCALAAVEGGNTPIADSREVYRRIPARIRERFADKRVMYVRNYGNGLDVPWQQVFSTDDRAAVERFCQRARIVCEWKDDGELRTRQVCQAVARHPRTQEQVWFNQAHLFHVSNLDARAREGLLAVFAEDELPRNAFYGDGSRIESSVLDEIRAVYRDATVEFPWQSGDVLLLDNMLVAHGRAPFRGPRKVMVAMAEAHRPDGGCGE